MKRNEIIGAGMALCFALSGCVSLEEQRTARIVFCADSLAPVAIIGGEKVSGFDVVTAVRDKKPDRVVLMAQAGAAPFVVMAMAQAIKIDRGGDDGVIIADTQADKAQAARICAAR